ncbi:MAG: hypothetical protein FJX53_12015, partial [Alphaproteobacteria bacterium]|nr:hypothetical protein [Alphaproteobacteria bacterium]
EYPQARALPIATGIISASAPTLFMKAEITAPTLHSSTMCRAGEVPSRISRSPTSVTTPPRASAWLSTSTAATVITAGLPKPENAASGFTRPASTQATSAATATTSQRSLSQTKASIVRAKMPSAKICSYVMAPRLSTATQTLTPRFPVLGCGTRGGSRMKIKRIEHVAIAVKDMQGSMAMLERLFDLKLEYKERIGATELAMYPIGQTYVELLQAVEPESKINDWIKERGESLFHLCFEVEDIDGALDELRGKGVKLLDEKPRTGHGGSRIAFLDPSSTGNILIELAEIPAH